jgi:hypothetical protein
MPSSVSVVGGREGTNRTRKRVLMTLSAVMVVAVVVGGEGPVETRVGEAERLGSEAAEEVEAVNGKILRICGEVVVLILDS